MASGRRGLLTTAEAADYLGVSERTLHNMRARGQVPAPVQLGPRAVRFLAHELEEAVRVLPRVTSTQEPEQLRRARGGG